MKASKHWLIQRLTAIATIPFGIIVIYKIVELFSGHGMNNFSTLLSSPLLMLSIILFTGFSLYHSMLGFEIIFEDYVTSPSKRAILNSGIKFVNIITFVFFLLALLRQI